MRVIYPPSENITPFRAPTMIFDRRFGWRCAGEHVPSDSELEAALESIIQEVERIKHALSKRA